MNRSYADISDVIAVDNEAAKKLLGEIMCIYTQQRAYNLVLQARTLKWFGGYCIGFAFDEVEENTSRTLGCLYFQQSGILFFNMLNNIL